MNKKKIITLIVAAAMVISMAGCTGNGSSSAGSQTVNSGASGTSASVLTADTAPETAVVKFSGKEELNITFGDFMKEYKYYLSSGGVTDDTTPEYAATLQQRREYIANYLVNSRVIYKKFEELGFSLTEEENKQIDEDTARGIDNMKETIKEQLLMQLPEDSELTDEEIAQQVEDKYNEIIGYCGLTFEDFRSWQEEIVIQNKLIDYVNQDYTLDYAQAEKQVADYIASTKENYEKDPSSYNYQSSGELWIPDGSKVVKHILIKFDDEAVNNIAALRNEEKDEEADKAREEAAATLKDKYDEVNAKVEAGDESFDSLADQYSDDTDTTLTYLVVPGTNQYMEEFTECSLSIENLGDIKTCITDYGYHIVKYIEQPKVTEEDIKIQTDLVYQYLIDANKEKNFNTKMTEWRKDFPFEIDRDILLLGEEEK